MILGLISLASLVAFLCNIYIVKSIDLFGAPLLFAVSLLTQFVLFVIFIYSLLRALRVPMGIVVSFLRSAVAGALANPYVSQWRQNHPTISNWLSNRLNSKNPYGLFLTLGLAISLLLFSVFVAILINVVRHGSLTQLDIRIIHLMPSIRTPLQTDFFRFVTFTNNSQTVLLLAALTIGILWVSRRRAIAVSVATMLISCQLANYITKSLVGRMRPEQLLSAYNQNSFSFPSGHTMQATALSGLVAYLLFRSYKSVVARIFIVLGYACTVVLVGLSRVYLGVHYPSDVLAAIFLGATLLALAITAIEIMVRYNLLQQNTSSLNNKNLIVVPVVIIIFSLAFNAAAIHLSPNHPAQKAISIGVLDQKPFIITSDVVIKKS